MLTQNLWEKYVCFLTPNEKNMMPAKDTHLEVGVELYPREKILSLLSCFPGKFEKPLAITVSQKQKATTFKWIKVHY